MAAVRLLLALLLEALCVHGQALDDKHTLTRLYGPCNYTINQTPCRARKGTVVIGGFFPLHEWNYAANNCSTAFRAESGFQRMEAFRWAVEKYGGRTSGFSDDGFIGYDIRDSCSKDTHTRDEALEFINVGTNCHDEFRDRPISIVVGASSSDVSMDLTNLQALFDVPQVSYAATTDRLNDSNRFEKFVRVVPPDVYQVRAIVSLLERFGWSYVSVVYTEDDYGRGAFKRLTLEANTYHGPSDFHFCLAARLQLSLSAQKQDYVNALLTLRSSSDSGGWNNRSQVVIVFAQAQTAAALLEAAMEMHSLASLAVTWIASDAWSGSVLTVKNNFPVAWGLISVEPFADHSDADVIQFNRRLRDMRFDDLPRHRWSAEFFNELFSHRNCVFSENRPPTSGCGQLKVSDSQLYAPDHKLPFVIQSVRVAVQAIVRALESSCPGRSAATLCAAAQTDVSLNRAIDGPTLVSALVSSHLGLNLTLHKGSRAYLNEAAPHKYAIYNLVLKEGTTWPFAAATDYNTLPFGYEYIGHWSTEGGVESGQLVIEREPTFNTADGLPPAAVCAYVCPAGHKRIIPIFAVSQFPDYCCWQCEECPEFEYAINSTSPNCVRCPPTQTHNKRKTGCVDIEKEYLKFGDTFSIVLIIASLLGCGATVFTAAGFVKARKTQLVVSSSRELVACLLSGIMLAYCLTFAFIATPTKATCTLQRFGLGFPMTICLASVLVRANRISRVFNMNKKKKPARNKSQIKLSYISPEWQVVFTGLITFIQVSYVSHVFGGELSCSSLCLLVFPLRFCGSRR